MDKTKTARARLKALIEEWHREARALAASERVRLAALGPLAAVMAQSKLRYWDIYAPTYDCLKRLAEHEEIGSLVVELRERRPLKLVDGITTFDWVPARPGLKPPTLPQELTIPMVWSIVVEALIPEWIDYLSEDAPPVAQAPKLGKQARAVLELLYRDKAFDEAHACHLTKRAPTQLKYDSAKSPDTKDKYAKTGAAELKRLKLLDAAPRVGTWLTTEGRALAESLFGPKPR